MAREVRGPVVESTLAACDHGDAPLANQGDAPLVDHGDAPLVDGT